MRFFAAIGLTGLAVLASAPAAMDGLRFEIVGTDVATTDALALPKRPNLSFEP